MKARLAMCVVAVGAGLALPAWADVTVKSQDGTLELTLPNGWHQMTPKGAEVKLIASDGHGTRLLVRVYAKEDYKDLKSLATVAAGRFKLDDAKPDSQDIQVNGQPGVRVNLTGTEPNGERVGLVVTVFEAGGSYIDVTGKAPASAIAKQQPVIAQLATQLKVTPAGAAPPPAAPAPAPGKTPPDKR
jgi:hypothetical protein